MRPEDLLDAALDAMIGRGAAPLDQLLLGRPDEPELRRLLAAAEGVRAGLVTRPSESARARHLELIDEAARASLPSPARAPHRRLRRRRRRLLTRVVLRPIAAVALIGALAAPAASALASEAVPGEALYGVKLAVEKLRLALRTDPADDVQLHLLFARRRLEELSEVASRPGFTLDVGPALANLKSHVSAAEAGLEELTAEGRPTAPLERSAQEVTREKPEVLGALVRAAGCDRHNPPPGNSQCPGLVGSYEDSLDAAKLPRPSPSKPATGAEPVSTPEPEQTIEPSPTPEDTGPTPEPTDTPEEPEETTGPTPLQTPTLPEVTPPSEISPTPPVLPSPPGLQVPGQVPVRPRR